MPRKHEFYFSFTLQKTHRYERQTLWLNAAQLPQPTVDTLTPNALFIILMKCDFIFPTHSKLCQLRVQTRKWNKTLKRKTSILCIQRPCEDISLCQVNTWEVEKEEDGLFTFYLISFGLYLTSVADFVFISSHEWQLKLALGHIEPDIISERLLF